MLTKDELHKMQAIQLDTVVKDELLDLRSVDISQVLSPYERLCSFIQQGGNLYCFKVGLITVKIGSGVKGNYINALAKGIANS